VPAHRLGGDSLSSHVTALTCLGLLFLVHLTSVPPLLGRFHVEICLVADIGLFTDA